MEQDRTMVRKRLIWFVTLTFVITWLIFGQIPLRGLTYGTGVTIYIVMAGMFVPALCNILTRLITREGFSNMMLGPNFKGHIKDYLLIFFGPTALLLLSVAVYFLIMPGMFDPQFTVLQEPAARTGVLTAQTLFLVTLLQVVIIGPIINIIPTLGEELGWRAYLLPKLRLLLSDRWALVVTGIIWGLWHAPVIAMGHNYGTDYMGYPWLGILMMVGFCVWLGIIEGYATIKMNSVFPAAMIHSTINAGAGLAILMAKNGSNPLLGPAITGLIGGLPFIVVAVILLKKAGDNQGTGTVLLP
ncbi:MAG: CPBP family intramembrane metalloprotease [Syntrophomonadaceae bacterium]|nr:CPBP family intramembrane metalloprotease [Syntrophomonadaceae bacterium]